MKNLSFPINFRKHAQNQPGHPSRPLSSCVPARLSLALLLGLLFFFSGGCRKDFEELNKNPNGFTTASNGSLFNSVLQSLIPPGNELFYINSEILYKQTQLGALGADAWGNFTIGTEEIWKNYYQALVNIRELEQRFEDMPPSPELRNMQAMVQIILAYKSLRMTDMFGDIPFFEAGKGFIDLAYLHPAYDSQESIYLFCLNELGRANDSLSLHSQNTGEPFHSFSQFDKLFNGDLLKWRKLANSLRLRHALRMAEVKPQEAGTIISAILETNQPLISGYDFITYLGENAAIRPIDVGFKNQGFAWSFREHKNLRMGSNIWRMMSSNDNEDGSGIFDIRAWYFFETNFAGQWKAFPQNPPSGQAPDGGTPYADHRDNSFSEKGQSCQFSPFNYFFVRDEERIPEMLISGAEVHFIKAEIFLRGIGINPDPGQGEIEFMQGLETSVKTWTEAIGSVKLPLNPSASFDTLIQVPEYLNFTYLLERVALWNFSSQKEKLDMIIAQRWIDYIRRPCEAWALARRSRATPREGDPLKYNRLPYPPSEQEYNTLNFLEATRIHGNSTEASVWWMGS